MADEQNITVQGTDERTTLLDIPDPYLNAIKHNWTRIAAFAWQNYVREGRGLVIFTPEDGHLSYHADDSGVGPVAVYSPERVVIVWLHGAKHSDVYTVAGTPTPPEADAVSPQQSNGVNGGRL